MKFTVCDIAPEEALRITDAFSGDYPFSVDSEKYLLVEEAIDKSAQIVLSVTGTVCENIVLIKNDKRMFNFLDLIAVLDRLSITEYSFGAESKLGNKYRFITKLLGGHYLEKDGAYYYKINTEIGRKYFYMKRLEQLRLRKIKDCKCIQDLLYTEAKSIRSVICKYVENPQFLELIKKEKDATLTKLDLIKIDLKRLDRYTENTQACIEKLLENQVNEFDEECVNALRLDDDGKNLDALVNERIMQTVDSCQKELQEIINSLMADFESGKNKEKQLAQKKLKQALYEKEQIQESFLIEDGSAKSPDYFRELDLLHKFLHDGKEIPKIQADTCKGCTDFNSEKEYCNNYKCKINIVPYIKCPKWSHKSRLHQSKKQTETSSKISDKCGNCAYYDAIKYFCNRNKIDITETTSELCHGHTTVQKMFPHCPSCGKMLNTDDKFCGHCGVARYMGMKYKSADKMFQYCPNCGKLMNIGDFFCGNCGAEAYAG
ncbi:MAG: hypothetical protein Ta2F_17630 [Termitinemataceae bacterium]|nr:MAG: hypothetical protein Ta2F_17630 [Termitinemataceae bacterium]